MRNGLASIAIWAISDPLVRNKIHVSNGHWVWTASLNGTGYGQIVRRVNGHNVERMAHKVVYEDLVGPIPDGYELHHKCWNRACVNPFHVEPLTHEENVRSNHTWQQNNSPSERNTPALGTGP